MPAEWSSIDPYGLVLLDFEQGSLQMSTAVRPEASTPVPLDGPTVTNEYPSVCEAVRDARKRLEDLWSKTGSHKRAQQIDNALLDLKEMQWDLERGRPGPGEPWSRPLWLRAALARATEVENETARWHTWIGWIWFLVFAAVLVLTFYQYVVLHLNTVVVTVNGEKAIQDILFWKDIPLKYVEIAFWLWFGLLIFTLYNIQHYVRQQHDMGLWLQWHLSKLLQGVFIGFVIALFLIEFKFGIAGLETDLSKAPMPVIVVLAFVLGYYSDRARDYLDVIRDRFLSGTDVPQVEVETPDDGTAVTADRVVVRGKVSGPHGMKGAVKVGNGSPMELDLDSSGNFAHQVEVARGLNLIKVEASGSNGKLGSKGIIVHRSGPTTVLTVTRPATDTIVKDEKMSVQGMLKDDAGSPVPSAAVWVCKDNLAPLSGLTDREGAFAIDVKLTPEKNILRVIARGADNALLTRTCEVTLAPEETPAPEGPAQPAAAASNGHRV